MKTTDGTPSACVINGYLQLVARTTQSPPIAYKTPLKLKDLNKIVKSLGVAWEDGMMTAATDNQINAEMIEKDICSVQFKKVRNRTITLSTVLEAMEEGDEDNVLNIFVRLWPPPKVLLEVLQAVF
jgi:hypothetical protein